MAKTIGNFNLPVPKAKLAKVWTLNNTTGASDDEMLATIAGAKAGDVAIIKKMDGEEVLGESPYMYDGTSWYGLVGTVDADKILLQSDITCAGNYTQVGNVTKTTTGTTTLSAKGKTVQEVFMEIFTKKLQPKITANPSISGWALTGAGNVEAGTKVATANFGTAALSAGSYTYGPATGVTATSWSVDRVCSPSSLSATAIATATSGTDNNGGNGFIIGDQGGDNVVDSLKYTITAQYSEGVVAKDNLGGNSDPEVKIAAGSTTKTTAAYTPFRKYFYGSLTSAAATVDSAFVRGLTNSTGAAAKGTKISVPVVEGAKRVVIAYPATLQDVSVIADTGAFGTDIKGSFEKKIVSVEGANGYTAIDYKVYVYDPATALGANTYDVTI